MDGVVYAFTLELDGTVTFDPADPLSDKLGSTLGSGSAGDRAPVNQNEPAIGGADSQWGREGVHGIYRQDPSPL